MNPRLTRSRWERIGCWLIGAAFVTLVATLALARRDEEVGHPLCLDASVWSANISSAKRLAEPDIAAQPSSSIADTAPPVDIQRLVEILRSGEVRPESWPATLSEQEVQALALRLIEEAFNE